MGADEHVFVGEGYERLVVGFVYELVQYCVALGGAFDADEFEQHVWCVFDVL